MRLSSQGKDVTQTSMEEAQDDCKPKKLVLLVCNALYMLYGLSETNTIGYYLTPPCVANGALEEPSLRELARVIKAGTCIEASFQRGKGEAGMDEYQGRTWEGWHHHMALTLIAVWFLIEETHRGQQLTPALTLPSRLWAEPAPAGSVLHARH